jgi:hypothetical protein
MGKILGFVEGADVLLIISLIIFMSVFILAIVYILTVSKEKISSLEVLPINENENNENEL